MNIRNSILIFSFALITFYIFSNVEFNKKEIFVRQDLQTVLIDSNNKPTLPLLELLKEFKVDHNGDLSSIVDATQKKWLRASGQERWQIDEIEVAQKNKVVELLKQLKCMDEIKPLNKNYDYCLLMGGLAARFQLRFAYLLDLWKQGIRFKNLIILGGQRPRDLQIENEEVFLKNLPYQVNKNWKFDGKFPETESEINKFIYNQMDFPKEFNEFVNVQFIDAKMKINSDGSLSRPNTGDTMHEWVKTNPKPGKCLVISTFNPYIGYQDSVVKTYISELFEIETVGQESLLNEKISVYLDTIARWLYQEKVRRKIS
jgi:hypothetical protein